MVLSKAEIEDMQRLLDGHRLYGRLTSRAELRCFMEHHVYSVWDFMSLIKYLQGVVAPTRCPWLPLGDGHLRRFINELVLEEESDRVVSAEGERFCSHFELYLEAMAEVGADHERPRRFVQQVEREGIEVALRGPHIPQPARIFTGHTFTMLQAGRAHVVAAALAIGREQVIPAMFRRLLSGLGVQRSAAPMFHYYLERHIDLDEGSHAGLSLRLLEALCGGDSQRIQEAVQAAQAAVAARVALWDGVLAALPTHAVRDVAPSPRF